MICVVINGPTFEEAYHQITKAIDYADVVELRLDNFFSIDLLALKKIKVQFSIPMIFTLRSCIQGGHYQKSEKIRLEEIKQLATLKPEYLDLEFYISLEFISEITSKHPEIKIILSYHNFENTPEKLEECYQEMQKIPAHYYKIAVTANNCLDALRFMCWAKQFKNKLIPISMGIHGQISRVLSPIIGSPLTYASQDENGSVLGQLTAKVLKEQYRYHCLNPDTKLYGLIGDPVYLSISDVTHNHIFKHFNMNAIYIKMQVKPIEIKEFLFLAKKLGFSGLSVTMPLKECILAFLDRVDKEALNCESVNTLFFENETIIGYNTDGIGALNALEKEVLVKGKRIVIIGAGGSAKAIAFEAKRRGSEITLINRNEEKAKIIGESLQCLGKGMDYIPKCAEIGYDIIINCTPVPRPIDSEYIISRTIIMDIVTKPKETEFLKEGRKKDCQIVYGYQMFIEQALGQFKLWFKNQYNSHLYRQVLVDSVVDCLDDQ